jgi:hypothetical protein
LLCLLDLFLLFFFFPTKSILDVYTAKTRKAKSDECGTSGSKIAKLRPVGKPLVSDHTLNQMPSTFYLINYK